MVYFWKIQSISVYRNVGEADTTELECFCAIYNIEDTGLHVKPSFPPLLSSSSLGLWGHFAKTWVSLQRITYESINTKYFAVKLLLS